MRRKLKDGFVGRDWMFEQIHTWLKGSEAKRTGPFLVIIGDPGVGKSALMIELAGKPGQVGRLEAWLPGPGLPYLQL